MAHRWTPSGALLGVACSILILEALSATTTPSGSLSSVASVASVQILLNSTSVPAGNNGTGGLVSSTVRNTAPADTIEPHACLPLHSHSYQPVPAVISVAAALCGCTMLVAGYRIYRVSFLIGGSMLGMLLSYVSLEEFDAVQRLGIEATVCIVVTIGAVLGLSTALIPVIGHVTMAMAFGSSLALAVLTVVAALHGLPTTTVAASTTAAAAAVAGAAAALALRRPRHQAAAAVTCMAAVGAALVVVFLDYFIELHALLASMHLVLRGIEAAQLDELQAIAAAQPQSVLPVTSESAVLTASATSVDSKLPQDGGQAAAAAAELILPCFYTWMLLAAWPLLAAVGALIQWNVTAKHVDPFTGLQCIKRSRRRASVTKTGAEGERGDEAAWERYRHIYTARRSAGDVVATAYAKGSKRFARVRGTPLQSDTDDEGTWTPVNGSCKV